MSEPRRDERVPDCAELSSRIEQLEAQLAVARAAARTAEAERGSVEGALTKATEQGVALAQAAGEWETLFAQTHEELRLANERLEAATRWRSAVETSTSWRLIQAILAPYRRLRGIR